MEYVNDHISNPDIFAKSSAENELDFAVESWKIWEDMIVNKSDYDISIDKDSLFILDIQ